MRRPAIISNRRGLLLMAVLATLGIMLVPATAAGAHPLGNFSVNQYLGLVLFPDRVQATVVVDAAEIPTLQDLSRVDTDGDETAEPAERAAHAATACATAAGAIGVRVDGAALTWSVSRSGYDHAAGAGGLAVSRLGCTLLAPATLDRPARLQIDNTYLSDRVGWREITASGNGVRLVDSPLPARSVSDELRAYPADLLASALDVRMATLRVEPGASNNSTVAAIARGGDPLSRWMATVDRHFADLVGGARLTPLVGLLAVLLAIVLGAGHAVLPGHGKTVLAAYLAGTRGRRRDALAVAGTVTLTHTAGVLALGLLITAGTAVAGERILGWLGLVSGGVVLAVGAGMMVSLVRGRRRTSAASHTHADTHHAHTHHDDDHGHRDHAHEHHDHAHGHHGHGQGQGQGHEHHDHGHHSHSVGHTHRGSPHGRGRTGRLGLAGIGLAGGLVPSPSALVVLLAAIGLGRTGFGVLLVVAYGLGMAATLTGAGLLLVALQRRLSRAATRGWSTASLSRLTARLHAATPAATATLVVLVGAGLAARAAAGVL